MYQITIGAEKRLESWISLVDKRLRPFVKNNGVIVLEEDRNRILLGVGVNDDINFNEVVSKVLRDFYLFDLKEDYLLLNIKKYIKDNFLLRIYVKVLKMFNVDEEKRLFLDRFRMCSNFSLDGFYKFRLGILKEKWNDLLVLTYNNIDLISDEYALVMLIKHLLSCLPIVSECVLIDYVDDKYKLVFREGKELLANNIEDVVCLLVENIPISVLVSKVASKTGIVEQINRVFSVKIV
ncbi:MAG: hypothetical protein E7353_00025 [Clostridiales bacterium]|nr:hypothetical protein [Clostridiales bacterium]